MTLSIPLSLPQQSLQHYDYVLPDELIAQEPLQNRSDAKMLVVHRNGQKSRSKSLEHRHIRDLPEFLCPNDCLVVNNTKVVPARLIGKRTKTGGRWEGLFIQQVAGVTQTSIWKIIGKTRGTIQIGETVTLQSPDSRNELQIEFLSRQDDSTWLVRPLSSILSAFTLLERIGWTPIPPYIRGGKPQAYDKERYQTVYAADSLEGVGSAAAPTAGLHLTPELLDSIKQKGISIVSLTLHVGLGTFKPMNAENIEEHTMHSEWCSLSEQSASQIELCRRNGGRIFAVGTTSVRVLESTTNPVQPFEGQTSLFIKPPYLFKNVDVLLTNFHFPKSTLLVLVRTFGGDELIQQAYHEAVQHKYRFFSYGDAMLIV